MKKKSDFEQMRPKTFYDKILRQRELDGVAFYNTYWDRFVEVTCPACNNNGQDTFNKYGFYHKKCSHCKTIYCSPRPTDKILQAYYCHYDAPKMWTELLLTADENRKRIQYRPRADLIVDVLKKNNCLSSGVALDLGAGAGTFALCLKETGYFKNIICLDFSEDCIRVCQKKGLKTFLGRISDFKYDGLNLICMNDLIEHAFDPSSILNECGRLLKKGGVVSIATPNCLGFDFQILKEKTKNITPPEHLTYFNPKSLDLLLSNSGFTTIYLQTPGKLDVDIIIKEIETGFDLKAQNEFLDFLFSQDVRILNRFQNFLSENLLSSHMLCLAQKN
jgi:SAM-dependent methyltransferase